jgi:hypothetical protein
LEFFSQFSKLNSFLVVNDEKIDPLISLKELLNVGWTSIDEKSLFDSVFEESGQLWAHRACAMWSDTVIRDDLKSTNVLTNVDKAMFKGFQQVCLAYLCQFNRQRSPLFLSLVTEMLIM